MPHSIDLFSNALAFSSIAMISLVCQWLAWRIRLPAILFLLLAGIVLGPMSGLLSPDLLLGELLFPVVSMSVALILFEGSLTLKFSELKDSGTSVKKLVSIGAIVTWSVISLACHWLIGLEPALAALFGALVVVTGPTVIVPMLRTVRANVKVAEVLRWEGIVIDPIGAVLAVLVYEWLVATSNGASGFVASLWMFAEVVIIGSVAGLLAGYSFAYCLKRNWLPEYLEILASVALVLATFSLSNQLAHESGLLAVTLMGIWLANDPEVDIEEILAFKENLSTLLISGLFILLAARMDITVLLSLGWPAIALLVVIQFVARPLAVMLSTLGSSLTLQERALVAWIGPRGIVAAAVSALFALRLEQAGYESASLISALTFAVIIGTVVFQSATARPMAELLGVVEREPRGLLLMGANSAARALAEQLKKLNLEVLLVDTDWQNVREAKMQGLSAIRGNPLSVNFEERINLSRFGHLLTLSPRHDWNTLLYKHYQRDFSEESLFSIRSERSVKIERLKMARSHQAILVGSEDMSYRKLSSLLSAGARFKTTKLTDGYHFEDWQKEAAGQKVVFFILASDQKLMAFDYQQEKAPQAGNILIYLDLDPNHTKANSAVAQGSVA